MAPPTPSSGHGRSPSNIAEHVQLVLDRGTSHENLQYVKVQMDKELAEERRRIEDPDEFKRLPTLSHEQLQARVAALQGLQAILRAFLRRMRENLLFWEGENEGGRGGGGGASAGLLQQGQMYEALLAEAEALVGGYLCMAFIRAQLEEDKDAWYHSVPGLPMPFVSSAAAAAAAAAEGEEDEHDMYGRDFDLVRSEVLREVWGLNENSSRSELATHRAPLEALLGPWWKLLMAGRRGHSSSSSSSSSNSSIERRLLPLALFRRPPPLLQHLLLVKCSRRPPKAKAPSTTTTWRRRATLPC